MKLIKLLEKTLYLQPVTIYDVETDIEYFTNEIVSEILYDVETDKYKLGGMKVKEIYTEHNMDVIYIGVKKVGD